MREKSSYRATKAEFGDATVPKGMVGCGSLPLFNRRSQCLSVLRKKKAGIFRVSLPSDRGTILYTRQSAEN